MENYQITSEEDGIDAICEGINLTDAIGEILHLNGYMEIQDTPDWEIHKI